MFLILFAAFVGTAVSLPLLWPYGIIATLVFCPFGGSLAALLASVVVAWRGGRSPNLVGDKAFDPL